MFIWVETKAQGMRAVALPYAFLGTRPEGSKKKLFEGDNLQIGFHGFIETINGDPTKICMDGIMQSVEGDKTIVGDTYQVCLDLRSQLITCMKATTKSKPPNLVANKEGNIRNSSVQFKFQCKIKTQMKKV